MTTVDAPATTRRRLSPLRQITIANLERSRDSAVPVTVQVDTEAAGLLAAKAHFAGSQVTVTALLASLLATTAASHPVLHSLVDNDESVLFDDVDLGVAVALDDGNLTVPVIHSAQRLAVRDLADRLTDVVDRAKRSKLTPTDVRGGRIALSSIGFAMPGVRGTPVLPAGYTAVLLVGAPVRVPVVRDGVVVAADELRLSLTVDHRVANGAEILAFLDDLKSRIAEPASHLGIDEEHRG